MKKFLSAMMVLLLLVGCTTKTPDDTNTNENTEAVNTSTENKNEPINAGTYTITETVNNTLQDTFVFNNTEYDISVSKRDLTGSYEEITGTVEFSGTDISTAGSNLSIDGNTVKISAAGTYVLSGNGQGTVLVETDSDSKVQLILDNLTLTSTDNAAILIGQAYKVFITLPDNTVNTISDTSSYSAVYDDSDVDAAIFSKDDLTINGNGSLIVNGKKSHGIVCKDELTVVGSNIQISSVKSGINANDAAKLVNANIKVNVGTDGIKADNSSDISKGIIYVNSSTLNITASDKGLQASAAILVDSGSLTISATDDGFNSDSIIVINDGVINVKSGGDAIHADYILEVNGGTIITDSAEGLEATLVNINGGDISVNASDDGINAAQKITGITPAITVNNGNITVIMGPGDTDGFDSNGNIIINGGNINVSGQSRFDYDGIGQLNGGTVIVNGTQISQLTNQMMGGPGGMGGQGGFYGGQPTPGGQGGQPATGGGFGGRGH